MHTSLALLVLAVCLPSAVCQLPSEDICTQYKSFKKNWICPSKSIMYNPFEVNNELLTGQNTGRRHYDGHMNAEGTADCVRDIARPKPVIARVSSRYRLIKLEELCKMEKIPIHNVYKDLNIGGIRKQHECIVVNTDWMRQDLYYARCVNPDYPTHDKCRMDYGSRNDFRCIQSGFVKKRVLLFCPDAENYVFATHTVPTTCSCRKCLHCDNNNDFLTGLLDELSTPFFK